MLDKKVMWCAEKGLKDLFAGEPIDPEEEERGKAEVPTILKEI